jgi:hypothetical protein
MYGILTGSGAPSTRPGPAVTRKSKKGAGAPSVDPSGATITVLPSKRDRRPTAKAAAAVAATPDEPQTPPARKRKGKQRAVATLSTPAAILFTPRRRHQPPPEPAAPLRAPSFHPTNSPTMAQPVQSSPGYDVFGSPLVGPHSTPDSLDFRHSPTEFLEGPPSSESGSKTSSSESGSSESGSSESRSSTSSKDQQGHRRAGPAGNRRRHAAADVWTFFDKERACLFCQ